MLGCPLPLVAMAAHKPDVISKSTAYNFRKELDSQKTLIYAGKGNPRVEEDLNEEDIEFRKQKLMELDEWLRKNGSSGE